MCRLNERTAVRVLVCGTRTRSSDLANSDRRSAPRKVIDFERRSRQMYRRVVDSLECVLDSLQGSAGFVRLGRTAGAGVHIPYGVGDAGGARDLAPSAQEVVLREVEIRGRPVLQLGRLHAPTPARDVVAGEEARPYVRAMLKVVRPGSLRLAVACAHSPMMSISRNISSNCAAVPIAGAGTCRPA
jgi:hypothetical protein